jgi:sialidase-1
VRGVAAAAVVAPAAGTAGGSPGCEASVPFRSGTDGYDTFRIPAIVQTRRGTLPAFAEGRRSGAGDTGDIDLTVKRSSDGGCAWGPLTVVADSGANVSGNPAPVVDPRTGRVVLLSTYNAGSVTEAQIMRGEVTAEQSRRVFVQHSDDDGALRVSRDGGVTWRNAFPVSGAPAAYSDMVQLGSTFGLLYETGDQGPYETITFRRIPLRALEG